MPQDPVQLLRPVLLLLVLFAHLRLEKKGVELGFGLLHAAGKLESAMEVVGARRTLLFRAGHDVLHEQRREEVIDVLVTDSLLPIGQGRGSPEGKQKRDDKRRVKESHRYNANLRKKRAHHPSRASGKRPPE